MKAMSSLLLDLSRGLSPNIAHMMELQSYLSFNDACHLDIKIEKQFKGQKSIDSSLARSPFTYNDLETPPHKSRLLIRIRELLVSYLKGWREINALNVMSLGVSS